MNYFETIVNEAAAMPWVDWVATLTGIVYVILAARSNIWCWFWGIISCGLWAYASFAYYQLYLDAILQLFYVGMGFAGIFQWKYGGKNKKELAVNRIEWHQHLYILAFGAVLAIAFGYFFDEYTPAAATYMDAFTTVFAVITTFLLVRRVLENWIYWVVIDTLYIYLYGSRGALLFAGLMIIYTLIAITAFFRWKKEYQGGDSQKKREFI